MFLQNKLKGRGGTPKRKISAKEYLKDSHMTKIIFSKFCNSVKAIYCKILLLFLIIFCFAMIFQLFVILNKVSKSAEIASLEFQLLILQRWNMGIFFLQLKYFPKILKLVWRFKKSSLKMRQSSSLNPSLNMKQGLLNNSLYCSWSSSLQSTTNPLLKMSSKHF